MTNGLSFEGKVAQILHDDEEQEQSATEAAEQAAQALADQRARRGGALALKEERDATYQGTPVLEVFSEDDARLCAEFLEFAEARSFAASTDVEDRERRQVPAPYSFVEPVHYEDDDTIHFRTRGYLIGSFPRNDKYQKFMRANYDATTNRFQRYRQPIPSGERYHVYLCEDGTLKRYDGSSLILDGQGEAIPPITGKLEDTLLKLAVEVERAASHT